MEIHKLLKRQLERQGILYDSLPKDLSRWQDLLKRLNATYIEADNERYRLERLMSVSSLEMKEINSKLEYAQSIAKMGYWQFYADAEVLIWSKGIYNILRLNPSSCTPSRELFFELVHPDYKDKLQFYDESALLKKMNYEYDFPVKIAENKYQWFRTIVRVDSESNILTGVLIDIDNEKKTADNILKLNKELLTTARLAGMSEIATSILHNIGNVMNSATVSTNMIKQNLNEAHQKRLLLLLTMIKENKDNITDFLLNDSKGKHILPYLAKAADTFESDYQINIKEIDLLETSMHHIRDIIAMQQTFSGVSGIVESIDIQALINDVLDLSNIRHSNIRIKQKLESNLIFSSDKSKILQIVVNLIQNARDSVLSCTLKRTKTIGIFAAKVNQDKFSIEITDNGLGIPKENLTKIFSFGFTTKDNGHGFGLHSAALAAEELGGRLKVHSNGLDRGAKFCLQLPIVKSSNKNREKQ
jgi:signal transduction histidine kinase